MINVFKDQLLKVRIYLSFLVYAFKLNIEYLRITKKVCVLIDTFLKLYWVNEVVMPNERLICLRVCSNEENDLNVSV